MICLKDLEKILEGKKGYKELLEKIEQENFSSIEGTDGWYIRKFVFIENNEIRENEKLVINDKQTVWDIIEGKINVLEVKKLEINIAVRNYFDEQKIEIFFNKFKNLESLNLGLNGLNKTRLGLKILRDFVRNTNIKSFDLGLTELHEIDGGGKILKGFVRNLNLISFSLSATKLHEIDGGGKILAHLIKKPNLE